MLQTRSNITLVAVVNTIAGGSIVQISNSAGWVVAVSNTNPLVSIQNSAGWVVNVANTANRTVIVNNSGGLYAMQSGTWTINVANSVNSVTVLNSSALSITNTVFAQSNTSPLVQVQNSAGWIFAQSNTSSLVQIQNSAGWIFAQSNTGNQTFTLLNSSALSITNTVFAQSNTSPLVSVQNSAGWVVNVANTLGTVAISNTSGLKVFATLETAQMSSNGIALTAGYAVINASGTNNTIVSAVATKRIRVLSYHIMSELGNNVRFQSGTGASNFLTGVSFIGTNGGLSAPYNPTGWFQTSGNNLLNLEMAFEQSVGGCLTYLEI